MRYDGLVFSSVQNDKAVTGCCIVRDWQVVERPYHNTQQYVLQMPLIVITS